MIKLVEKTVIYIAPTKPFHFDSTFFKPAHFSTNDTKFQPGKRWQTMLFRGERLGTVFENAGTAKNPKVKIAIYSQKKLSSEFTDSVKNEVIWRYNLNLDLSGFYKDLDKDPLLKPIIKKFRGLRPMHTGSLYEYLIIDIVLQNATVRRSVSMMQSLFENYGTLLGFVVPVPRLPRLKPGLVSKSQGTRNKKDGFNKCQHRHWDVIFGKTSGGRGVTSTFLGWKNWLGYNQSIRHGNTH